ncbi:hypothetical protein [Miniimonas arenae]|uniref:hypothetical protein n=1 Tax=Miniimonas arenae TaxID=676201 RepID=UPI0028AE0DFB|nr:hypothetical protein [Miniimonas arenae]
MTVTYAGAASDAVEVAGFVSIKDSGTCTAEVTNGSGASATASGPSYEDATTTSCGTLTVPTDELGDGPVTVRLGFTSDRYEGWSTTVEVSR